MSRARARGRTLPGITGARRGVVSMRTMGSPLHFEVLADCPHCRVESARVEVFEGRSILSGFGVPIEARCRLCDATWEGGTEPELPSVTAIPGRCPACKVPLAAEATET